MKKYIHSLFALLMLVVLCSWNGDDKLKDIVKYMNSMCPYFISEEMSMENITYSKDNVTMTYVIYGGYYNFDAIRANDQVFRNNFLIMIANNTNPTIQTFIELLLDAKADLTIVLKNDKGEKYSMHFVAEDLKNIMGNPDKDLNVFLQSMIANTKLNLPIKIEEGITLTDIFLENGYCIYVYTCDESILKIDLLQANDAALKTIMKRELYEKPDLVMKSICEMLRSTNNGLEYRYVGATSGKSYTCRIEADELLLPPESDNDGCKTYVEGTMSVCVPQHLYVERETEAEGVSVIVVEDGETLYVFTELKFDLEEDYVLNQMFLENPEFEISHSDSIKKTVFMSYDARQLRFDYLLDGKMGHAIALAFNGLNGNSYCIMVSSDTTPDWHDSIVNSFRITKTNYNLRDALHFVEEAVKPYLGISNDEENVSLEKFELDSTKDVIKIALRLNDVSEIDIEYLSIEDKTEVYDNFKKSSVEIINEITESYPSLKRSLDENYQFVVEIYDKDKILLYTYTLTKEDCRKK